MMPQSSPSFQFLPRLSDDEYRSLEDSIREHGIQVPILVDESKSVIDGHHRKEIADRLGIECPRRFAFDLTDEQKRTLALTLNLDRRHLTREQKRAVVEASLKADPDLSDVQHAKRTGVSDKTVAAVRVPMAATSEIPRSPTRVSADGRQRPANQPARVNEVTEVTGLHGPAIPAPKPKPKPRRASFPDAYRYAVDDLDKVVRRIERLHADGRFLGYREDLQQRRGGLLTEITSVVSGIESDLGGHLKCPSCEQRMLPDRSWSELLCTECRQVRGVR